LFDTVETTNECSKKAWEGPVQAIAEDSSESLNRSQIIGQSPLVFSKSEKGKIEILRSLIRVGLPLLRSRNDAYINSANDYPTQEGIVLDFYARVREVLE